MTRASLGLSLLALACGAAVAPSTAALDGARHAPRDASTAPGTSCHGGRPFDRARGCVYEGVGIPGLVRHQNAMSSAFQWVGAAYALDGVLVFDTNDPVLLRERELPVLQTPLRPGAHELAVLLRYRGHGSGVFSYLSGYQFTVKKALRFEVPAHGSADVVVVGEENADPSVPLEKRPQISVRLTAR